MDEQVRVFLQCGLNHLQETGPLLTGESMVGGVGEVGENALEIKPGGLHDLPQEGGGFLPPGTHPAHPSVHFQVNLQRGTGIAGKVGKPFELRVIGQTGDQIVIDQCLVLLLEQGTEYKNGPARSHLSDVDRFLDIGNGKQIHTALHQTGGSGVNPMPVGIRLDHGYILHLFGQGRTNAVQIALEGGEVDFRPASHGVHSRKEIDS